MDCPHNFSVVHVAETIRGGIATYLRQIITRQVTRYGPGRVAVVVPVDQIGDLGDPSGVVLVGVKRGRSRLHTALGVRLQLSKLLAISPTEILHVHSAFAGMTCRFPFASKRGFERLVYCPHGWAFVRIGRTARLAAQIERALTWRSDAIVCVSKAEKTVALHNGLPEQKLTTIYNGLPDRPAPEYEEGESNGRPLRLVFVGRLDQQKGFDVLVAALRCTKRNLEVHAFGESVLGEYITDKLPSSIQMHGWQHFETIEPWLLQCDALVMPSRWEGLPLAAIEAMRSGKPIIASAVGGLVELIEDGITGDLVEPGDVDALANVIESAERSKLVAMGRRARKRFLKQFRVEQCESKLAELYEAILERSE